VVGVVNGPGITSLSSGYSKPVGAVYQDVVRFWFPRPTWTLSHLEGSRLKAWGSILATYWEIRENLLPLMGEEMAQNPSGTANDMSRLLGILEAKEVCASKVDNLSRSHPSSPQENMLCSLRRTTRAIDWFCTAPLLVPAFARLRLIAGTGRRMVQSQ
jgi:hypothetical protein